MSVSPFTGKSGKCSNFGNCSMADAHTVVQVPSGMDFVCTECGKPLLLSQSTGTAAGGSGGGQTMQIIVLAIVVLALLGGGAWFLLRGKKTSAPPSPQAITVPVDTPASAPLTGNCSDADAQAGLCRKK
jgi:phosphate transport system substrate-binding protein